MSFLKASWAAPIFVGILFFIFFMFKSLRKRESFLADTFFKRPTKIVFLKKFFFMLGMIFLGISLLDPRGPQEKIESSVPDQKTIIIIDSSASMLAEDVRPNRFKKSILMARHFIKKAFGHKIAVVLFSDIQKKLVPFTDDLDLLDARVAGLEDLRIYDGGSNISQAIKESLGYFRTDKGDINDVGGNVLVFTDSEGHDEDFDLSLPSNVSLAVVGVGTAKGARIPNRDRYGVFRGYKKYKSKEVISRLNEDWLKALAGKINTYKYWVANSYTIPTEEILAFFNKYFTKKINKGSAVVRPVKVDNFLIPSMIFFSLSFLLYYPQSFALPLILLLLTTSSKTMAVEKKDINQEMADQLREKMKEGKLNAQGKLKFAEILLRAKESAAAQIIYEEQKKKLGYKDKNNYAVTLLMNKNPVKALKVFTEIQKDDHAGVINMSDQEKSELRQNILLALQKKKQQGKQDQKDKEKEEKEKKDGDGKGSGQSGDKSEDQKGKKGGDDKEKKKEKGKDKNKSKNQDEQKGEKKKKGETLKEKQDRIRKKRKMVKIPGLIKQIMSDDRNLQKKYLDTSTSEPKAYQKKDW